MTNKKTKITARKSQPDDQASWVVLIDNKPFATGLLYSEVKYYKAKAAKIVE